MTPQTVEDVLDLLQFLRKDIPNLKKQADSSSDLFWSGYTTAIDTISSILNEAAVPGDGISLHDGKIGIIEDPGPASN